MSYLISGNGWNAYLTSRLLHGEPLYLPVPGFFGTKPGFPVIPVNYPPLSFLLVGAEAEEYARR